MSDNAGNNKRIDKPKPTGNADKDAILIALDQLSQTMEVMSQVVSRLKRTVEQARFSERSAELSDGNKTAKVLRQYYQRKQGNMKKSSDTKSEPNVQTPITIH